MVGYYNINLGCSLVIEDIIWEGLKEKILVHEKTYSYTEGNYTETKARKYKVYESERKGSYFNYKGHRVYLSECLRY